MAEASLELVDANRKLIKMNRDLLDEKEKLIDKEKYLLTAMNDSLKVKEPKRFLIHRMSIAPFEPVDYIEN